MLRKLSSGYAAGTVGALVAVVTLWLLARDGVTSWMGIAYRPPFTGTWLMTRLVKGGLWGLPLALPVLENRVMLRGLITAAFPAAYTMLVLYPQTGKGTLGLNYGTFAPVLLVALFALWGIVAAGWYRQTR